MAKRIGGIVLGELPREWERAEDLPDEGGPMKGLKEAWMPGAQPIGCRTDRAPNRAGAEPIGRPGCGHGRAAPPVQKSRPKRVSGKTGSGPACDEAPRQLGSLTVRLDPDTARVPPILPIDSSGIEAEGGGARPAMHASPAGRQAARAQA